MKFKIEELTKTLKGRMIAGINELGESYQAIEVLPELNMRFKRWLNDSLVSARMYQTQKGCFFETTVDEEQEIIGPDLNALHDFPPSGNYNSNVNFRIRRSYLNYPAWMHCNVKGFETVDELCFSPLRPVVENAIILLTGLEDLYALNNNDLFNEENRMIDYIVEQEYDHKDLPRVGKIILDAKTLLEMGTKHLSEDPEFLPLHNFSCYTNDNKLAFLMPVLDDDHRRSPYIVPEDMPGFISINSITEFEHMMMEISLPVSEVESLEIETHLSSPDSCLVPEFVLKVHTGNKNNLMINGDVVEYYSGEPRWYFRYIVNYIHE